MTLLLSSLWPRYSLPCAASEPMLSLVASSSITLHCLRCSPSILCFGVHNYNLHMWPSCVTWFRHVIQLALSMIFACGLHMRHLHSWLLAPNISTYDFHMCNPVWCWLLQFPWAQFTIPNLSMIFPPTRHAISLWLLLTHLLFPIFFLTLHTNFLSLWQATDNKLL